MIGLIVAAIVLSALALGSWFFCVWTDHDFWWAVAVMLTICAVFTIPIAPIVNWSAEHAETTCYQIGEEAQRDVKFIRPSSFVWKCLTPSDGGWIEIDRVLKVED